MAPPDQPQAPPQPHQQQTSTFPQPVPTSLEGSQFHQTQTASGLPPLPQNHPSWTDLTSPNQTGSAPTPLRRQQASQTSTTQPAMPRQTTPQQPPSMPLEAQQPQPQQSRSQSGVPAGQPAEAVLVPHTVSQVGSHVFPIGNGQYQIRVISYLEVLFPMVPCHAQPSHP